MLLHARLLNSFFKPSWKRVAVNMVSMSLTRFRIPRKSMRCEQKLPLKFAMGMGIFFGQGRTR